MYKSSGSHLSQISFRRSKIYIFSLDSRRVGDEFHDLIALIESKTINAITSTCFRQADANWCIVELNDIFALSKWWKIYNLSDDSVLLIEQLVSPFEIAWREEDRERTSRRTCNIRDVTFIDIYNYL